MTARSWLPQPGEQVRAVCGCVGATCAATHDHGGSVHVHITAPCTSGHPFPWTVTVGVIEHFWLEHVRPTVHQLATDLPTIEMEQAA